MTRTRKKLDQPKPEWLGNYKKCSKVNPFTQHYKTYEGCTFRDLTIHVGDFVLVSNADADEPDTLEGCDVARIEHLFESTTTKGDKYRTNVQWYSEPSKIPESIDSDLMDDRYEVVEDCRKFDSNVSIETIYKRCSVISAYEDENPEEVYLKNKDGAGIVFVCRYRLKQKNSKFYIEPVLNLDGIMNPDEGNSHSGNNTMEKKFSKDMPNTILNEDQEDLSKSKDGLENGARAAKQRRNPSTPKSKVSNSENELQKKVYSRLRSSLRKCSIDSDSENSRTSSPAKHAVTFMEDSDLENSPKSTPRKNPPRSSKRIETPLKSNHFNTSGSESNYLNGEKDHGQSMPKNKKSKSLDDTNQVGLNTPTKSEVQNSARKRKAFRSSSEESLEPRSPSMSPRINCAGPPAVFKLYQTKGQTFVIKKPIDIERKVPKKLNESNISSLLSSDDSDSESIFDKLEQSGAKIVARSKSDNMGFELLTTPNKNGVSFENIPENNKVQTPKSARRNLSQTLDIEDSRKDLLLKKLANKREDASLRIKLRRSSEQSTYKIDSDSDGNSNTRSRRRTGVGTPKSILKANSKGPGTPSVKFSNQDEIKEYSPITDLSKKLMKVEIKLKRIETEEVRKSPRNRKANTRYSDYYEIVKSPITNNAETPKKRTRRTINYNEDDDPDRTPRKTRSQASSAKKSVGISSEEPKTPNRVSEMNEKDSAKVTKNKFEAVEQSKTPRSSKRTMKTDDISSPRKGSRMEYEEIETTTPKKTAHTPKLQTPSRSVKSGLLTPSMRQRNIRIAEPSTPLQEARARLHVSAVPKSLPCREEEFNNIYTFLEGKLRDNTGGCLYISGVPGTGKTATVNEVIRCLKKSVSKGKVDNFDFIEINAMKLTEPRQAYVMILKQLTGKKATWEQAHQMLDKRFTTAAPRRIMTLLLVDELDILCNKRQDVVYNLLDWPAKSSAQLVVITIANTMDLPERVLMGRVTSRLGLTRLTFQPYTHKQLQEIVTARLNDSHAFKSEAIQLVARKVAAVSGDARRALDICRRATEVAEVNKSEIVSMQDVNEALTEMIASVKVQAIKHCSELEQMFLQAVCAEIARTGVEEVVFKNIYIQLTSLCTLEGLEEPSVMDALTICAKLGAHRLLICEHSRADVHQRVLLNVSSDDVHFAMQNIEV